MRWKLIFAILKNQQSHQIHVIIYCTIDMFYKKHDHERILPLDIHNNVWHSGMQPQAIMESLFSGTEHLIHPFSVTVEMKGRRVANVLCRFWALVNIRIHKWQFLKAVAQLAESWENLTTYTTPEKDINEFYIQEFRPLEKAA